MKIAQNQEKLLTGYPQLEKNGPMVPKFKNCGKPVDKVSIKWLYREAIKIEKNESENNREKELSRRNIEEIINIYPAKFQDCVQPRQVWGDPKSNIIVDI